MEIKYILTEEDYIQFNLFHIKNSKTAMTALKFQRLLIPILYIIVGFVLAKVSDGPLSLWLSIFLLLGIAWFFFYPKYFYRSVMRRVQKMLKEGKNEGLLGEHCLVLSKEGIHDTTMSGETSAKWPSIQTFAEDEQNLYLYNTSLSAYIIPKREIQNLDEFHKYVNKLIANA